MNKFLLTLFVSIGFCGCLPAQNTLFDDSRVSAIYIDLPADSLAWIYANVLSDHYVMARFVFDDNENRDTLYDVGFRLRGNTSRYSMKKSFKISFNTYVSGRRYQGVKKVNLNGEHNDPTMIREKFYYDLWKKAGMVERRTAFVRVYINQVYYGLYTNLEEMDKDWLGRVFPDNKGNLYKCTWPADLAYLGPDQQVYKNIESGSATGGRAYDLQTNESADDYTRLVNLITELNRTPDSAFASDIGKIMHTDHFLKALALDVATGNWDDYGYNKNNYYLYDNPSSGQFEFITYDPDNTFGVDWFDIDWAERNCLAWINSSLNLPLAEKLLAVPAFFDRYKSFLDTIAHTIIVPDSAFPLADRIKLLITAAAEEDTYRCLDYGYTIADFHNGFTQAIDDHTPYGIKPFLSKRAVKILEQLTEPGIFEQSSACPFVRIYPNPATDHVNLAFTETGIIKAEGMILDLSGRLVHSFRSDVTLNRTFCLGLSGISQGVYFIRILSGGQESTFKLFKQ